MRATTETRSFRKSAFTLNATSVTAVRVFFSIRLASETDAQRFVLNAKPKGRCLWPGNGLSYVRPSVRG